ncbi:MAG: hypothetical protein Q4A13_00555, partial [Fretibacterium sp.]|nr:hypothetical protein [Fretibacterium sp.]
EVNGFSRSALPDKRRFLQEFRLQLNLLKIPYKERKSNGRYFFHEIELTQGARALAKLNFSRLPSHGL